MNEQAKQPAPIGRAELSLWDAARLLLEKVHWILLAGIAAGLLVYLGVSLLVTPTYESHVSFYVFNSSNGTVQSGTVNNSDLQAAESLATTYSKILASNSVLDAVLDNLGMDGSLSRKELGGMVEVSVVPDTQILEVVVASPDPQFACKIADAFARVAPTEIVRITKVGGVEVVDRPEVAAEKSSPRTVFDSAIGFVAGAVVMAVVLILRMMADTTIYLPEDIEKATGMTVLGQIPNIGIPDETYAYWKLEEGGGNGHEAGKKKQGKNHA